MVDIKKRALRALKENPFSGPALLIKKMPDRRHKRDDLRCNLAKLFKERFRRNLVAPQAPPDGIVMKQKPVDLSRERLHIEKIAHSDCPAADFVFIGRTNPATGGAECRSRAGRFPDFIELLMDREDQAGVFGNFEGVRRDRDAVGLKAADLFQKRMRVKNNAVSDYRDLTRTHDAGRQEAQLVHLAVNDECVARIVSALEPDNNIRPLRKPVHNFALAFIAPLGSDYDNIRHGRVFLLMINPDSRRGADTVYKHAGTEKASPVLSLPRGMVAVAPMLKSVILRLWNQPQLLLITTMLIWSGNLVLGRGVRFDIPPVTLSQTRWVGAALIIVPFALPYVKKDWPVIRAHPVRFLLLALTGVSGFNTLAYIGLSQTEALNALLIQSALPLMIAFMTFLLYRDRLTPGQVVGLIVSCLGVMMIATRGNLFRLGELVINPGDLWLIVAFGVYAVYSAMIKKSPQIHPLSFLCVTVVVGAICLTPFFAAEYAGGARVNLTPAALASFLYVILFPSIIAVLTFYQGVKLIGPNRAAPYLHLTPVFGSFMAIVILGEQFMSFHGIGYVLIIAGIFVSQWKLQESGGVAKPDK